MSAERSAAAEWRPSVNPWLVAGAVMLATFMEVLDTTIVSVALPNMAGSLASSNDEATWVLTSYLVANAVVLPASGWFSLHFGRKRFLLACTALFTFASFLCAFAPSMPVLILARILQGAGGGALQPLSQAILLESFPREKQGMAMAAFGFGVVGAPIIGPFLGGWLTDNYSWRWVFNINIPIGVVALYLMARYVEDPPYIKNGKPGSIDAIGFGLLAVWLATLQVVLDKGQQEDWFSSTWITWFAVISAVSLIALIVRELRTPEPIVDLRVFRNRNFWVGAAVTTVIMAGMYSALTVLPLFLQTLLGYTSQSAGLATAPRGIGAMIAMPVVGLLMSYLDGRWLMSAGVACVAVATFMFGALTLDVSMASIVWPNVIYGVGMGLTMVPIMTMALGTLSNEKIGNASGIFNLMRNLGGSIGISVSTTYLARMTQAHQANLVAAMTPYSPVFQQRLAALTAAMRRYSVRPIAQMQAYGVLNGILLQQSNLKAYVDMFCWTAVIVALCLPGVWLLRKVVSKGNISLH
jgi:DHA2 family multidrug resistance protein